MDAPAAPVPQSEAEITANYLSLLTKLTMIQAGRDAPESSPTSPSNIKPPRMVEMVLDIDHFFAIVIQAIDKWREYVTAQHAGLMRLDEAFDTLCEFIDTLTLAPSDTHLVIFDECNDIRELLCKRAQYYSIWTNVEKHFRVRVSDIDSTYTYATAQDEAIAQLKEEFKTLRCFFNDTLFRAPGRYQDAHLEVTKVFRRLLHNAKHAPPDINASGLLERILPIFNTASNQAEAEIACIAELGEASDRKYELIIAGGKSVETDPVMLQMVANMQYLRRCATDEYPLKSILRMKSKFVQS